MFRSILIPASVASALPSLSLFSLTQLSAAADLILRCDGRRLKIARLPAFADFMKLGREREGAIFLDIGCCCMYSPRSRHSQSPAHSSLTTPFDSWKRCQKGYRRRMAFAE